MALRLWLRPSHDGDHRVVVAAYSDRRGLWPDAVFGQMLTACAQDRGAGPTKRLALVLDGAGWHSGADVPVPEGIHLLPVPSYAPALQPAEHLWPLTNEPLVNVYVPDLDSLEEMQAQRCLTLQQQPDLVRRHTLFPWWPTDG